MRERIRIKKKKVRNILHKTVAPAATSLILLELDKLELTKRFEDILEIIFSDTEMNVTNVQPVKRRGSGMARIRVSGLTILLGFSQLRNDGNP